MSCQNTASDRQTVQIIVDACDAAIFGRHQRYPGFGGDVDAGLAKINIVAIKSPDGVLNDQVYKSGIRVDPRYFVARRRTLLPGYNIRYLISVDDNDTKLLGALVDNKKISLAEADSSNASKKTSFAYVWYIIWRKGEEFTSTVLQREQRRKK
jgi:hypothetical protein